MSFSLERTFSTSARRAGSVKISGEEKVRVMGDMNSLTLGSGRCMNPREQPLGEGDLLLERLGDLAELLPDVRLLLQLSLEL